MLRGKISYVSLLRPLRNSDVAIPKWRFTGGGTDFFQQKTNHIHKHLSKIVYAFSYNRITNLTNHHKVNFISLKQNCFILQVTSDYSPKNLSFTGLTTPLFQFCSYFPNTIPALCYIISRCSLERKHLNKI